MLSSFVTLCDDLVSELCGSKLLTNNSDFVEFKGLGKIPLQFMPKCPFPIRISFFSYFVNESRILLRDPFKLAIHLRFSSSVSVSPKPSMEAENPLEAPISEKMFKSTSKMGPISGKMFKSAPKMGSYKLGDSTL